MAIINMFQAGFNSAINEVIRMFTKPKDDERPSKGVPIKASDLLIKLREKIVGLHINTEPVGDWPGGNAKITRVCDDDENIAFFVKHDVSRIRKKFGEMGIFKYEDVIILD